jgi:hypothetical protein
MLPAGASSQASPPPVSAPFADLHLARRLERAEGLTNAWSVEARARLHPGAGAAWIQVAGAWAMFDGVDSPLTQTFGLGLAPGPEDPDAPGSGHDRGDPDIPATPRDRDLDEIEAFFHRRGAMVAHEVSPLAGPETHGMLVRRGYRPVEFSSVLVRRIEGSPGGGAAEPGAGSPGDGATTEGSAVLVRPIRPGEEEHWSRVCAEGWSEFPEFADLIMNLARITTTRAGSTAFLAERGGMSIATGGLSIVDGIALLSGASTIPSARRQGAQRELLASRLRHAAEAGCDLAMMVAQPGSASQRNAERQGFRIAYTRIKWLLPHPRPPATPSGPVPDPGPGPGPGPDPGPGPGPGPGREGAP